MEKANQMPVLLFNYDANVNSCTTLLFYTYPEYAGTTVEDIWIDISSQR